jgi:hypothetical protein
VVEKHCVRSGWEYAGARKIGKVVCRRGFRVSCLKQLWGRRFDMATINVFRLFEIAVESPDLN